MSSKYENIFEYLVVDEVDFITEIERSDYEEDFINLCECCGEILYDTILITNNISGIVYDACLVCKYPTGSYTY